MSAVDLTRAGVRVALTAGNCLCEHVNHDAGDPHVYGAPAELTHWYVQISGPVCLPCATECLAEWSRTVPGDVVELPAPAEPEERGAYLRADEVDE